MAKALLGYAGGSDPRVTSRLANENRHLRQRVVDLENVILQLQQENDALEAVVHRDVDAAVDRVVARANDEVLEPA